jgi:hypothetical protein
MKNFAFAIGAIVVLTILYFLQPGLVHRTWCNIIVPLKSSDYKQEYFLECSNVQQQIISMDNVSDQPSDDSPWGVFTPKDPTRPGLLHVKVKKDRDRLILYPRTSSAQDAVTIQEFNGYKRRILFYEAGSEKGWTPISRQYNLELSCADSGWEDRLIDVELLITINGKWGQVWHKDNAIFF